MPDLTIGDYEIDEDSNGNLVIKDKNDTVVFQYDDASSTFQPQVEFDFGSNDISNVGSINTEKSQTNIIEYKEAPQNLIDFETFALSENETQNLNDVLSSQIGLLIVRRDFAAGTGLFDLEGNFNDVVDLVDGEGYSTTQGQSTTNVYHNGTDYILESTASGSVDYSLTLIGGS